MLTSGALIGLGLCLGSLLARLTGVSSCVKSISVLVTFLLASFFVTSGLAFALALVLALALALAFALVLGFSAAVSVDADFSSGCS